MGISYKTETASSDDSALSDQSLHRALFTELPVGAYLSFSVATFSEGPWCAEKQTGSYTIAATKENVPSHMCV